jgi:hypothetical protein
VHRVEERENLNRSIALSVLCRVGGEMGAIESSGNNLVLDVIVKDSGASPIGQRLSVQSQGIPRSPGGAPVLSVLKSMLN